MDGARVDAAESRTDRLHLREQQRRAQAHPRSDAGPRAAQPKGSRAPLFVTSTNRVGLRTRTRFRMAVVANLFSTLFNYPMRTFCSAHRASSRHVSRDVLNTSNQLRAIVASLGRHHTARQSGRAAESQHGRKSTFFIHGA